MRSHNRARLFNETAARLHIAYIIFLLTLIASEEIDRTGNTIVVLYTLTAIAVFILMWSIFVSGRTLIRIRKSVDQNGVLHKCISPKGICHVPVGWRMGCKVCLSNGLAAFAVGMVCLALAVNPSLIKQGQARGGFVKGQEKDYYDTLRGLYTHIAGQTKEQFEAKVMGNKEDKYKDDKLNVSYWFSHNGVIHQLGTTHEASAEDTYKVNEESIIGCGFVHQNSSVRWDDVTKEAVIWPYYEPPQPRDSCKYATLQIAKIRSIVCATYNGSGAKNPEQAVGICIFTTGPRNVTGNQNYQEFLKTKAEEFHNSISGLLKNKTLIPPQPPQ